MLKTGITCLLDGIIQAKMKEPISLIKFVIDHEILTVYISKKVIGCSFQWMNMPEKVKKERKKERKKEQMW